MLFVQGGNGLPADTDPRSGEHKTDKGGHKGLQPSMPVGMIFIRGAGPVVGACNYGNIGGGIGQAVNGVGNKGLASAEITGRKF